MKHFLDTSFFRQRFTKGAGRETAAKHEAAIKQEVGYLPITSLVRFEFIQSVRLDSWLNKADKKKGLPPAIAEALVNLFLAEDYKLVKLHSDTIIARAEMLSRQTPEKGCRSMDILQIASADVLGATAFYSFDRRQNELAEFIGLETPLMRHAV